MALLICCSSPCVAILTPMIYNMVKTWFAAGRGRYKSAGSRTDWNDNLPFYTSGFE